MEPRLEKSAEAGDISALYALIKQDPCILEHIDEIPFANTPLHIATSAGQTHFAIEIISLKPSFGRKLNLDGLTPLDLALQNGHYETVRRLVKFDAELIRVKGRERFTPLHYVAETDNIDLLAEFLYACPASIEDLTIRDESALHIAVKNFRLRAFNVLLGWLSRTYKTWVLNWRDEDGNTALHIAAATNQAQVVRKLIKKKTRTDLENLEGLTGLDLIQNDTNNGEVLKILLDAKAHKAPSLRKFFGLADFLSSEEPFYEAMLGYFLQLRKYFTMEMLNVVLVVAVLIATSTYQGVLSPPGGLWQAQVETNPSNSSTTFTNRSILQENQNKSSFSSISAGHVVMDSANFAKFFITNTIAFYFSILVLSITLPIGPHSILVHLCLIFMWVSYFISFEVLSPDYLNAFYYVFQIIFLFIFVVSFYSRLGFWYISHRVYQTGSKQRLWAIRLQMLLGLFGIAYSPNQLMEQTTRASAT